MPNRVKSLQYYPSFYFLEKMNPSAKFISLISLSAILFISLNVWVHTGILIACAFLFAFSPFSFSRLQGAKFLIITAILIGMLQLVFIDSGTPLVTFSFLQITNMGIFKAISASARFISVILFSYLFVLSTDPSNFVLSLVKLGIPYRFGFTLITALRIVPMVKSEVKKITYAQITRGASLCPFPIKKLIANTSRFLKVVMIAMLKRVNHLVISMEGRSFGLYKERSTLGAMSYKWFDWAVIIIAIAIIPFAILWR